MSKTKTISLACKRSKRLSKVHLLDSVQPVHLLSGLTLNDHERNYNYSFFFILPNHFFRMEKQRKMILLKPKILVLPILMLYT